MAEDLEKDRFKLVYRLKSIQRLTSDPKKFLNPFMDGFAFDLYVYVSENETSFESEAELLWVEKNLSISKENLTYERDRLYRELQTDIPISEVSSCLISSSRSNTIL